MNRPLGTLSKPTCKDCPRRVEPLAVRCVGCAARYEYTGPIPETVCEAVERS